MMRLNKDDITVTDNIDETCKEMRFNYVCLTAKQNREATPKQLRLICSYEYSNHPDAGNNKLLPGE